MYKKTDYLVSKIDDSYLLWFSSSNRFVLFNKIQLDLFKKFNLSIDEESFVKKTSVDVSIYDEFNKLIKFENKILLKLDKIEFVDFETISLLNLISSLNSL